MTRRKAAITNRVLEALGLPVPVDLVPKRVAKVATKPKAAPLDATKESMPLNLVNPNRPWREDPEILDRLDKTADLFLQKLTTREISEKTGVSHTSVQNDLKRICQLRRERLGDHEAGELLEDLRQASLAQFDKVIKEAWRRINAVDDAHSTMVVPKLLAEISTAEREKAKLEGTVAPIRNEVSGPMGGRIEVSVDQRTALLGRITGLIVHSTEGEDHSVFIPEGGGDPSEGLALLGEAEATPA